MMKKIRLAVFLIATLAIAYFSMSSTKAQHKDTIFTGATMTYQPIIINGIEFPDCWGPPKTCLMVIVEHECGCSEDGN